MNRKLAVFVPIGALLVAMWAVKLPYYEQGPGPAEDVEPLIHVHGHQVSTSGGHFILTSVSFQNIDVFQAIANCFPPRARHRQFARIHQSVLVVESFSA